MLRLSNFPKNLRKTAFSLGLWRFLWIIALLALVTACTPTAQPTQTVIHIQLTADKETLVLELPAGSTVQQALNKAGLKMGELDRSEPAAYTVLEDGAEVKLVRVTEKFEIEQSAIPFIQQTLRNESLPVEKEILIQPGKNGIQEITYRRVYEDGVQITSQPIAVKSVVIQEAVPEIRMIGVQTPLTPIEIPGKLYYLRDGNLWLIEGNTANRKALITTGDLDGRALSFSGDGSWVLVTRKAQEAGQINSLWTTSLVEQTGTPAAEPATPQEKLADLKVKNITQFADFVPGSNAKIVFSTVEPREAAPGWQANNDLTGLNFSPNGWTTKQISIVDSNAGGVYGWWGTTFLWGPDPNLIAFARPDSVGLADYLTGAMTTTLNILPLQTHEDWAWAPGLTWGPDGKALYTVDHIAPDGATNPEESQIFDLTAILLDGGPTLHLVSQVGMFAYPLASPLWDIAGGKDYQIAYLQALFPDQSETSRYRLAVVDRDGSNRRSIFPPEDKPGLEPQQYWGAWSPAPLKDKDGNDLGFALAVIHQGNLWIVNTRTGEAQQITADGLTRRVVWR